MGGGAVMALFVGHADGRRSANGNDRESHLGGRSSLRRTVTPFPANSVHEIVWEFRPAPNRERDFEAAYGPAGPWVHLFRRGAGYLGTELIPPREPGGWYRTIDRWESAAAYERFRETWGTEYRALDGACASLTSEERPVPAGTSARGLT